MKTPSSQKLTLKGDTPEKVAKKGIDPKELTPYTGALEASDVDISKETQAIAKKVVECIAKEKSPSGQSFAELYDMLNGSGFMKNLEKRIATDLSELAISSACQTRAYKDTLIANTALESADFVATPKGAKTTVTANPFA